MNTRHLLMVALTLIGTNALALEGKTAIYAPTTIAAPGSYILTRNITGAAPLITITSSDVTLDLNGFTLESTSTTVGYVITATSVDRVSIFGGRTKAGARGVSLEFVNGAVIRDLVVNASSSIGINLYQVKDFVVSDCSVENPGGPGILADLSDFSGQGVIERNHVYSSGLDGIFVTSLDGGAIRGNLIIDSSQRGIYVQSSESVAIQGNTVVGAITEGISIPSGTGLRVVENIVRGSGSDGLRIGASDVTILRNLSTANTSDGLLASGDQLLIAGNQSAANSKKGLHFDASADRCVYRANFARGNLGGGPGCGAAGGTNDFCNEGTVNSSPNDNFMPSRM